MPRPIYLDHNSTTPLKPEVLDAMMPFLTERYGNASSLHAYGRAARNAVESARDAVARLIGAEPSEIVFTSGGTESDNLAIHGILNAARDRNRLVTTAIEHHAVLETAKWHQRRGVPVTFVGVDRFGHVDLDALRDALDDGTALVSVMHANNEVGTLQPIGEIAEIARERSVPLHTDAVQTVGRIPVSVAELGANLLSLSAHKFGGPKGVGALYVRQGTRIERLHHGGSHERNRRGGTENVAGIVGLGRAAELALEGVASESARLRDLTDEFLAQIAARIEGYEINSPSDRTPGTVSLSFHDVIGENLILALDLEGVCVSTGSACTSGSMEPSHVLRAMGLPPEIAQGTIRFSFGSGNDSEQATETVDILARLLERMRQRKPRARAVNEGAAG
ncbi:cysteine desulfurase [Candidatus Poribacteria bacterium]|nr:cysteine desulfurase [Candidatus Poribacteria bacterium]